MGIKKRHRYYEHSLQCLDGRFHGHRHLILDVRADLECLAAFESFPVGLDVEVAVVGAIVHGERHSKVGRHLYNSKPELLARVQWLEIGRGISKVTLARRAPGRPGPAQYTAS